MKKKFYVVDCRFKDWVNEIVENSGVLYASSIENVPNDAKIIPIDIRDFKRYINDKRLSFKMNIESIDTLNNKCLFAMFMMKHYVENIPKTIYVSRTSNN